MKIQFNFEMHIHTVAEFVTDPSISASVNEQVKPESEQLLPLTELPHVVIPPSNALFQKLLESLLDLYLGNLMALNTASKA